MRKKVTLPDGTVEEFEGTAEEMAELEQRLREGGSLPSRTTKRKLLKEEKRDAESATIDDIADMLRREFDRQREKSWMERPWWMEPCFPNQPWIVPLTPPNITPWITWTTNTDNTLQVDNSTPFISAFEVKN